MHAPVIDIKVGVLPQYGVSFQLQLFKCLANIPSKEVPLLALHLLKSCTKAKMRVPLIVTNAAREKGMEYKENKGKLW